MTDPTVTLAAGGGYGRPTTEERTVELNIAGPVPDLSTGMKTFVPVHARLYYRRTFRAGEWSGWLVRVVVSGPRRLSSGAASGRSTVSATYRPDAAPGSMYAPPAYLMPVVAEWHPDPEGPAYDISAEAALRDAERAARR